jgi:hypothetical protein
MFVAGFVIGFFAGLYTCHRLCHAEPVKHAKFGSEPRLDTPTI